MIHILKKAFPVLLGAGIGYAYWYFIGCLNGHCPITSNWHTSTIYGAIVGASFLLPSRKRKPAQVQQQTVHVNDHTGKEG